MAAYPSITMTADVEAVGSARTDVSDGGTVRIVDLQESTPYTIKIDHPYLTQSEKDTLLTFYNANKGLPVTLTINGDTFDAYFVRGYSFSVQNSVYCTANVTLIGNIQ